MYARLLWDNYSNPQTMENKKWRTGGYPGVNPGGGGRNKIQVYHYNMTFIVASEKQGNSVARDLPRTGSETNTTIFVIYILDIDSHCPL